MAYNHLFCSLCCQTRTQWCKNKPIHIKLSFRGCTSCWEGTIYHPKLSQQRKFINILFPPKIRLPHPSSADTYSLLCSNGPWNFELYYHVPLLDCDEACLAANSSALLIENLSVLSILWVLEFTSLDSSSKTAFKLPCKI